MSNAFDKLMSQSESGGEPVPSTSKVGRPMHQHWFGYKKVTVGVNGKPAAKCLNCLNLVMNTGKARLLKHRETCGSDNIANNESAEKGEKTKDDAKEMGVDTELEFTMESSDDSRPQSRSSSRPNSSLSQHSELQVALPGFRTPKQQKLKRFMDEVKPVESDKLDSLAAMFFYGCNIPFRVADSIYFKNFVKALRPAYNPPHRLILSGKLLDKTYETIEQRNKELIGKMDKRVILLVDGWQNSSANRHCEVMMLATANDQKVFLESYDFSGKRETGENLFKAVDEAIVLAKERYDATVYAILTDNAYNMQKMGKAAQEKNLLYSTCNAHSANLLAGDILKKPSNSRVMAKVMDVQKDFKRTSLEKLLLEAEGNKPVLSCATRWTSQRNAIESFLKNLSSMKTVSVNCDKAAESDPEAITPKPGVSASLFDQEFIASVKTLLEKLNPVAELTNFCQKSTSSAADASEKWMKLLQDGPGELREFLGNRVIKSNILNIVTMTANFLHPIYRGNRLNPDERKKVTAYLFDKLEGAALDSLREFTEGEGTFATLFRKNLISPKTFWHFAAELGHDNLASFAMDYLKIPASTAQLERLFSNWSYIHSDIRNRLSDDTSKKLVNTYFTLRSTEKLVYDDDDFEIQSDYLEIDE